MIGWLMIVSCYQYVQGASSIKPVDRIEKLVGE
jgi:hypothetical protein